MKVNAVVIKSEIIKFDLNQIGHVKIVLLFPDEKHYEKNHQNFRIPHCGGAGSRLDFLKLAALPTQRARSRKRKPIDVVVIGGGIMSMTLSTFLQELQPDWNIEAFERLDAVGLESSNGLNNAGTGHAAFAELNYTPREKRRGGNRPRRAHHRAI